MREGGFNQEKESRAGANSDSAHPGTPALRRVLVWTLVLFLGPPQLLQAQTAPPRVVILSTGGTIASRTVAPMVEGHELVQAVPAVLEHARVEVEEVVRIGSSQMTPGVWLTLADRINALLAEDPDLRGIVVTHGTDTLEETAFFLNLTVRDTRPVVVVGSMRSSDEISADGSANLLNAVRVAVSPGAEGKGVLVVLNESISSARDVWKTHNRRVDTFRSPDLGALGVADPDAVVFYRSPIQRHTAATEFEVAGDRPLPAVPIVHDYVGFDARLIRQALATDPAGLVVATFAGGRMSAGARTGIQEAVEAGVPVVIASRVPGGRIVGDVSGDGALTVARDLPPHKARILLMLALDAGLRGADLQRVFDTY